MWNAPDYDEYCKIYNMRVVHRREITSQSLQGMSCAFFGCNFCQGSVIMCRKGFKLKG